MKSLKVKLIIVGVAALIVVSIWLENRPANKVEKPDFDIAFQTSMLECSVLGIDFTDLEWETLLEYGKENSLPYVEEFKCYVGEGYAIEDARESYDWVYFYGLDCGMRFYENNFILLNESWEKHRLLTDYADTDISVVEQDILGKSFEEFFDGLADGLYEAVKEKDVVTTLNGTVWDATEEWPGTWGTSEITAQWVIYYQEDGMQKSVRLKSISGETIDMVNIMEEFTLE